MLGDAMFDGVYFGRRREIGERVQAERGKALPGEASPT